MRQVEEIAKLYKKQNNAIVELHHKIIEIAQQQQKTATIATKAHIKKQQNIRNKNCERATTTINKNKIKIGMYKMSSYI